MRAKDICNKFLNTLEKDIKTYYGGELISNTKIWNKVAKKASNEMKSLPKDATE